jgi:hypothetical protein
MPFGLMSIIIRPKTEMHAEHVTLRPKVKRVVTAKTLQFERADGLVASADLDDLVAEVGDPYAPTDVLFSHWEATIAEANGGFASYLTSFLFGEDTPEELRFDLEAGSVAGGWRASNAFVGMGVVVVVAPIISLLVEVRQAGDLPADFVQEVAFDELIESFFLALSLSVGGDAQPDAQRFRHMLELGAALASGVHELPAPVR